MHIHQADSVVLTFLFWATKYVFYFLALYFAFHGAVNLIQATGHVVHFAFKTFRKYSFGFFLVAVYCFAVATAFYSVATPHFWASIQPYFFKNAIVTVACEVIFIVLPVNLKNTFVFEAEKHQIRINDPEGLNNQ